MKSALSLLIGLVSGVWFVLVGNGLIQIWLWGEAFPMPIAIEVLFGLTIGLFAANSARIIIGGEEANRATLVDR